MHITRIVEHVSDGAQTLVYNLNGFRIFINRDSKEVGVDRKSIFDVWDAELCELVEEIGLMDSGQQKINPANKNIQDFLKITKCIK